MSKKHIGPSAPIGDTLKACSFEKHPILGIFRSPKKVIGWVLKKIENLTNLCNWDTGIASASSPTCLPCASCNKPSCCTCDMRESLDRSIWPLSLRSHIPARSPDLVRPRAQAQELRRIKVKCIWKMTNLFSCFWLRLSFFLFPHPLSFCGQKTFSWAWG